MAEINGLGDVLANSTNQPEVGLGEVGAAEPTDSGYSDALPLPKPRQANIFTHNIFTRKSFEKTFEQNKRGVFEVQYRTAQNTTNQATGFIVNKRENADGTFTYHLWTNAHVVFDTIDGLMETSAVTEYTYYELRNATNPEHPVTIEDVRVLNTDIVLDLAVISFTSREDFPVCRLAAEADPHTLDPILLVGNTSGTGISVNEGKIKQPRAGMSVCSFGAFQHDAEVTGGNSGSPIFNRWGEVIGMHFRSKEGIVRYGFASDDAYESYARMLESLGQNGVLYGDWGITAREIEAFERVERFRNLPVQYHKAGIEVLNVNPNSAAASAGIQPGDDILAINGETDLVKIETNLLLYRFYEMVRRSHAGENYTLTIHRDGQVFDVSLTARETLYSSPEVFDTKRGFKVLDFPMGYRDINGISDEVQGVLAVMDDAMDDDKDTNSNLPFLNRSIVVGIYTKNADGQMICHQTPTVEEFRRIFENIPQGEKFGIVYNATPSRYFGGGYYSAGPSGLGYTFFD